MAVITQALFERLTDRIGKQTSVIMAAADSVKGASVEAGFSGLYAFGTVTTSDDYDVETALSRSAKSLDDTFSQETVIRGFGAMTSLLNSLDSHLRAIGYTTIDAYCSGIGATVCQEFADYYEAIKGVEINEDYIDARTPEL
jgi:hypothetical protein